MSESKIRLLIADDHAVVRKGLVAMVEDEPDMQVVAEASDGQEAVDQFCDVRPDVCLLDLRMPKMNAVEAIAAIRQHNPNARLIILTTYDTDEAIYQGLRAGAKGYLLKDATIDELLNCIRTVHGGKICLPSAIAAKLAEHTTSPQLSDREREVLQLMAMGNNNHDIATALVVAESTVKYHVNHILSKLGVNDRTQAVILGLKRGLVSLE
ncbi:two component transcriptional regulator, LuxR family protein [Calothrix sp. NIES-4071]|nr:two component transcriptional regulator, LuxR family protein [Calothrix sp. NIES-4071]BAZ59405.1 two component transcriptional regulator, LuxR family protein [Calothrix sp. NIES-4105]